MSTIIYNNSTLKDKLNPKAKSLIIYDGIENYYENIVVDNLKFLLHINKEDEYDEEIKYDIKNYVIKFLKPMNISIDLGVNIFLLFA